MTSLQEGKSWSGEFWVRRREGATFLGTVTDALIRDERGRLSGIIGISSDITERKRLEEALIRSEARFRKRPWSARERAASESPRSSRTCRGPPS
jgi:PAS domain-containing protein